MRTSLVADLLAGVSLLAASASPCGAQSAAEIQKQLNNQVLNQHVTTKDDSELNAYLEEATRNGVVPREYAGTHWRRGSTCDDLRGYSWNEYRDCMYYYRYYGHYYPYP